jgi:hypothetical protein
VSLDQLSMGAQVVAVRFRVVKVGGACLELVSVGLNLTEVDLKNSRRT